ncbi:hypothetical protein GCM10012278_05950 [Nonomuraea glycinis]|uniref:Uncharacterized protein n=1 Tax=Nonomuraea glycinis TaxID=2047744 RepID=A0A918A0S0_9ACTN|nr:hypothetical protein GCM10012278_05950 [Nonomuraea glycinis]
MAHVEHDECDIDQLRVGQGRVGVVGEPGRQVIGGVRALVGAERASDSTVRASLNPVTSYARAPFSRSNGRTAPPAEQSAHRTGAVPRFTTSCLVARKGHPAKIYGALRKID